jgi:hypothetical protein
MAEGTRTCFVFLQKLTVVVPVVLAVGKWIHGKVAGDGLAKKNSLVCHETNEERTRRQSDSAPAITSKARGDQGRCPHILKTGLKTTATSLPARSLSGAVLMGQTSSTTDSKFGFLICGSTVVEESQPHRPKFVQVEAPTQSVSHRYHDSTSNRSFHSGKESFVLDLVSHILPCLLSPTLTTV